MLYDDKHCISSFRVGLRSMIENFLLSSGNNAHACHIVACTMWHNVQASVMSITVIHIHNVIVILKAYMI